MNNFKTLTLVSVSLFLIFILMSSNKLTKKTSYLMVNKMAQDTLKWAAPASADSLINPYEANNENLTIGALVYKKHCRSCHGRAGLGNGVEAADLSTVATDFTKPTFTEQTEGSMFWKILEGRNDMETFKKKLNEEDIWLVVLYIKTFSEKPKK